MITGIIRMHSSNAKYVYYHHYLSKVCNGLCIHNLQVRSLSLECGSAWMRSIYPVSPHPCVHPSGRPTDQPSIQFICQFEWRTLWCVATSIKGLWLPSLLRATGWWWSWLWWQWMCCEVWRYSWLCISNSLER